MRRASLAGCVAVIALLAACATPPIESPAAAPAVGDCHELDRPEHFAVLSDSAPAVPCDESHTTETFVVAELAPSAQFENRYPALEERPEIAELACPGDTVRDYVGADLRQALYGLSSVAVLPTPGEWAEGARWVRCDLVMVAGEGAAFEPLDSDYSLRDAAASGNADALLRCYTRSGVEAQDVRCSEPHDSRDVNMWMPVAGQPTELEIVELCVPSVTEWAAFAGQTAGGVSGVLHTESNGSLTLRCVVEVDDDAG